MSVRDQVLHGFQISAELLDALVPGRGVGRRGFCGPVSFGPFRGLVLLAAAEFEDVVLRDAEMFEEHPRRVREIVWLCAAQFR